MRRLGFKEYVPVSLQGHIITSFRSPQSPAFDFGNFYALLNDRGFVIYPGKVSDEDGFRIGNIGRLSTSDVRSLLGAVESSLAEMGIALPTPVTVSK